MNAYNLTNHPTNYATHPYNSPIQHKSEKNAATKETKRDTVPTTSLADASAINADSDTEASVIMEKEAATSGKKEVEEESDSLTQFISFQGSRERVGLY